MAIGDLSSKPAYADRVTMFPPHAEAVTPSDSTVYPSAVSIYVGTGGDVSVIPALPAGASAITVTVADGGFVPFLVRQVNATGTTATDILAVW